QLWSRLTLWWSKRMANPYQVVKPNKGSVFTNIIPPDTQSYDPRLQYGSYMGSNMNSLAVGKGDTSFKVDSNGVWLGSNLFTDAPFSVYIHEVLRAVGAIISGAVQGGTIDIGEDLANGFHVDAEGNMWIGAEKFADAPFSVTKDGDVTM